MISFVGPEMSFVHLLSIIKDQSCLSVYAINDKKRRATEDCIAHAAECVTTGSWEHL